jgi:hypothetical protein
LHLLTFFGSISICIFYFRPKKLKYTTLASANPVQEAMDHPKQMYSQHKLSRNQSLLKIVSHNDADSQLTTAEHTPNASNSYKQMNRSESIQSETLVELNNCIAQFEKFSYFTNETFGKDKDVCFSEISNKLVGCWAPGQVGDR